jgi:hypothetical protein
MWNTYFILTRFVSAPKNEQHLGQMKQQIQVVHLEKENKVRTSPFIDVAPGQTFHQTTPQQQSGHFGKLPLSGRRKRLLLSSGILAVSSLKSRTGLSLRSGVGFLDLREPMKPRFSTVPLPKGSQTIRLYQVDQQHVYVTFEMNTKTESRKYGREENIKVMAMSMSLSTDGWKTQPPIELPGALLAIKHTNESTYFITTDVSTTKTTDVASLGYKAWKQTQYDDPSYTLATRQIHLCQQLKNENKCSYINKLTFPHTDIENVRWNGDFLVLTGRRNWYWQRLNRSKLQKTNHVPIHLSYSLTADGLTLKK